MIIIRYLIVCFSYRSMSNTSEQWDAPPTWRQRFVPEPDDDLKELDEKGDDEDQMAAPWTNVGHTHEDVDQRHNWRVNVEPYDDCKDQMPALVVVIGHTHEDVDQQR
jgi:hypothetical protein